MAKRTLLTQASFGPVEYFAYLNKGPVTIEKHSHYSRQTYRNRYHIVAANGPMALTIPVEKQKSKKVADKDVKIAYHTSWQSNHWNSLVSAYNSSPFFQFYCDEIELFFKKKHTWLFDFNLEATEVISDLLGIDLQLTFTDEYIDIPPNDTLDLREEIHPKKSLDSRILDFQPTAYKQVFDDRHGFIANLSILDLLFNKGPEAILFLENQTAASGENM